MKAFLLALVALLVITVGANQILRGIGFSIVETTVSSKNVRLPDQNE
jgi:hypothetical protein